MIVVALINSLLYLADIAMMGFLGWNGYNAFNDIPPLAGQNPRIMLTDKTSGAVAAGANGPAAAS